MSDRSHKHVYKLRSKRFYSWLCLSPSVSESSSLAPLQTVFLQTNNSVVSFFSSEIRENAMTTRRDIYDRALLKRADWARRGPTPCSVIISPRMRLRLPLIFRPLPRVAPFLYNVRPDLTPPARRGEINAYGGCYEGMVFALRGLFFRRVPCFTGGRRKRKCGFVLVWL